MQEHPDRETLKRFITDELVADRACPVERHLSVCSACRDQADEISARLMLQSLDSWLRPSYDAAFERAVDRAADCLTCLQAESQSTDDLLAALMREPIAERRRRIAGEERFHSARLSQLLLARSRNQCFSDPFEALRMADLAVEVSIHLSSGRYGSSLVEDSRALSWAHLANAFRITGDYWKAEQALRQAWTHHVLGGADSYTEAELLEFTAALRGTQGSTAQAIELTDKRIAICRDAQDKHLEGAALLQKGFLLLEDGSFQAAMSSLREGLLRLELGREPRLVFSGRYNMILCLAYTGCPEKAQRLLARYKPAEREVSQIDLARVRWVEGIVANYLGENSRAEALLSGVREFFLGRGLAVEVFSSSLDLAQIHLLKGKRRQAKATLGELIPLGDALGLHKETIAARLLYEQAARA